MVGGCQSTQRNWRIIFVFYFDFPPGNRAAPEGVVWPRDQRCLGTPQEKTQRVESNPTNATVMVSAKKRAPDKRRRNGHWNPHPSVAPILAGGSPTSSSSRARLDIVKRGEPRCFFLLHQKSGKDICNISDHIDMTLVHRIKAFIRCRGTEQRREGSV